MKRCNCCNAFHCVDCKNYVPPSDLSVRDDGCKLSNSIGAYAMREEGGKCGPKAKLFEAKENCNEN